MSLAISAVVGAAAAYALASMLRDLLRDGRIWVIGPPALALGLTLSGLSLVWFGRLAPFAAVLGGLIALLMLAAYATRRLRRRSAPAWSWGLGPRATLGYLAMALFAGTGAMVLWSASVWGGVTHENLFQHTGLSTMLARQPSELRHPLEPDHPLVYRLAYHYTVAGASQVTGLAVSAAIQWVTVAALALSVLTLFAAVGRWESQSAAFVASGLFLAGGPVGLVAGRLPPAGDGFLLDRIVTTLQRLPSGSTHPGPLGQLPLINGTLVFGYLVASLVLFLYVALWRTGGVRALTLAGLAGLALGALAAAAESLFVVVAGALLLDLGRRLVVARLRPSILGPALAVVAPVAVVLVTTSGLLAADAAAAGSRSRLGLMFSGSLVGHAPTAALASLPQAEISERLASGDGWIPMWSLDFLLDVGFTPLLALAAFAWLARRRSLLGSLLAASALLSFGVVAVVTVATYPWDTYRFTQSGMVLGYAAAGVAIVDVAGLAAVRVRRFIWTAIAVGVLVASSAYLASAAAWPELAARREGADYALDIQLTSELAVASESAPRLLVVPGATDWFGLHRSGDEAIVKYVVAYGGVVPMGHDWYGHYAAYSLRYAGAYRSLDPAALEDLGISHLYLLPNRLDRDQERGLERMLLTGRAELVAAAGAGAMRREVYRLVRLGAAP